MVLFSGFWVWLELTFWSGFGVFNASSMSSSLVDGFMNVFWLSLISDDFDVILAIPLLLVIQVFDTCSI
jgi:hypothetical protein